MTVTATLDVPSGAPARLATPAPGDPRLSRLSLNQKTVDSWSLSDAIAGCVAHGLPALGVWREPVAQVGLADAVRMVRDAGLRVSSVCRGGFFTSADPVTRRERHDDNRRALDEAAELGAPCLVLVPGGLPDDDRDLPGSPRRERPRRSRRWCRTRSTSAYAWPSSRCTRSSPPTAVSCPPCGQALDIAEPLPAEAVGVVVDTFHVWWEPEVEEQIARAAGRIASYQVCEWITPLPPDALLSRGMMGDGHIDFPHLTSCVSAAGYRGDVEVEIFNADVWAADGDAVLDTLTRRYVELVEPHL